MTFTTSELLALFDQDQRREAGYFGGRREVTQRTVRMLHDEAIGGDGTVLFSDIDAESADETIRAEIAYFEAAGRGFDWKLYTHDAPSDLLDRLAKAGFEIGEEEAVMVLDLAHGRELLRQGVSGQVSRIEGTDAVAAALSVQAAIWDDLPDLPQMIVNESEAAPENITVYAALVDGKPVSSAWIRFQAGSKFAGLWGGSTLPEYRGRGFYSALLAIRAQEAASRGVQFLTVDASPMSRPILERFGFRMITRTYPCTWRRTVKPNLHRTDA